MTLYPKQPCTVQVRGLPISALRKQRIVVVGAGSAGMGVVRMIAQGAPALLSRPNVSAHQRRTPKPGRSALDCSQRPAHPTQAGRWHVMCTPSCVTAAGMKKQGATDREACDHFWVTDYRGLVTSERADLTPAVAPFARKLGDGEVPHAEFRTTCPD